MKKARKLLDVCLCAIHTFMLVSLSSLVTGSWKQVHVGLEFSINDERMSLPGIEG